MTTFRSEEGLVGLVTLGVVLWIGWTLRRGLRDGKLPIGRSYLKRDERPGAFRALLVFWIAMAIFAAIISLDLLFNMDVKFWL